MVTFRNNNNIRRNNYRRNDRNFKSNGDKILSENYMQHADHFTRILNEQENLRKSRLDENKSINLETSLKTINAVGATKEESADKDRSISDIKKIEKNQTEAS